MVEAFFQVGEEPLLLEAFELLKQDRIADEDFEDAAAQGPDLGARRDEVAGGGGPGELQFLPRGDRRQSVVGEEAGQQVADLLRPADLETAP